MQHDMRPTMHPHATPTNPPELPSPEPAPTAAGWALCSTCSRTDALIFRPRGVIWGVLRTFCGRAAAPSLPPPPPQTPNMSAAHGATAHMGVTVTPAAKASQLHTCPIAARPCARSRQRCPCAAQAAPKMGAGVGECGCKRRRCGVQPLPHTREDPLPAWGRFFPHYRRKNAHACAQQQSERHVRLV
jgi:hypothetical protein